MAERTEKTKKSAARRVIAALLCLALLAAAASAAINAVVLLTAKSRVVAPKEAYAFDADAVLVLGASVRPDGQLSHMLEDRVLGGVDVALNGKTKILLMSGDHGQDDYDEVNAMKEEALRLGVDEANIYLDHAGFSTYESLYRAKEIFKTEKLIIVTQSYHLKRALYIAGRLGIEAVGLPSDPRSYGNMTYNYQREYLARCKDFFYCLFKPEPTYLGEAIPIGVAPAEDSYDETTVSDMVIYTQLLTPTTEKSTTAEVTTTFAPPASTDALISEKQTGDGLGYGAKWSDDEMLKGVPVPDAILSSVRETENDKGKIITAESKKFSYEKYLAYLDTLEKAGFKDKNNRASVPEAAPSSVAMFYSPFNGKVTLGVYWHGDESKSAFDLQIVAFSYDPITEEE